MIGLFVALDKRIGGIMKTLKLITCVILGFALTACGGNKMTPSSLVNGMLSFSADSEQYAMPSNEILYKITHGGLRAHPAADTTTLYKDGRLVRRYTDGSSEVMKQLNKPTIENLIALVNGINDDDFWHLVPASNTLVCDIYFKYELNIVNDFHPSGKLVTLAEQVDCGSYYELAVNLSIFSGTVAVGPNSIKYVGDLIVDYITNVLSEI